MGENANLIYLILFFLCLMTSAFFSSSETAFISLQRVRIRHMVSSGVAGADEVEKMVQQPDRLLATVLLGNNFVNTAAAALGTLIAVDVLGEGVGVVVATVAVTIMLLIFAEIVPKIVATRTSERMALLYVNPMRIIATIMSPVTLILAKIASSVGEFVGGGEAPRGLISEEEIRAMISLGRDEGAVEEDEADMMERVFQFGDRQVAEIMTPRTDIVWVEKDTKLENFLEIYAQAPHARFPVFEGMRDHVVGVLGIKDVLMAQAKKELGEGSVVTDLARPVHFVPETKIIGELFGEMQEQNIHMAIVVDEYGGTAGLVSIEQILEEIVGQLGDELAVGEKPVETIGFNTYQVSGGMKLEQANEELALGLPEGDYETLAGFILHALGHIPKEGERLKHEEVTLTVTEMKGVKIEKVLVIKA
ncbi:MAG: hemolysin family protein [Dehalococcoidia bacterium]|nr:hemolysin family protein [Dehalococcoidia bacterium]